MTYLQILGLPYLLHFLYSRGDSRGLFLLPLDPVAKMVNVQKSIIRLIMKESFMEITGLLLSLTSFAMFLIIFCGRSI